MNNTEFGNHLKGKRYKYREQVKVRKDKNTMTHINLNLTRRNEILGPSVTKGTSRKGDPVSPDNASVNHKAKRVCQI